jgi:plastocyanin
MKAQNQGGNEMKRSLTVMLAFLLVFAVIGTSFAATPVKSDMKVVLDGKSLSFGSTYVVDGRLVLPYRAIAEELGAKVGYISSSKTVTVQKGSTSISLKIGSKTATVNGRTVSLDVSAVIVNSSTYVPVRFLSENLGLTVHYSNATKTVTLKSSSSTSTQTYQVKISNFAFAPETITISAGSKLVFTNYDGSEHTVTAKDGSFDSGLFGKGETYTRTFTKAGTYEIYCKPHPFMVMKIIVK